jgi:mercuric ion binding protein
MFIAMLLLSSVASAGEVVISVKGMVCSMCAQGIEKKFKKLDAVEGIKVNLDDKRVSVQTIAGQDLADEQIKSIISEAGYSVERIERK